MRRVLVPLDGSALAESILLDARRLAGPDGELILIRAVASSKHDPVTRESSAYYALESAAKYLEDQARPLRAVGAKVETHALHMGATESIDEAARMYRADMIACATHGRGPFGRLLHGGVAWQALAHSPLPVLLRHPTGRRDDFWQSAPRRIMVPLDGSLYAEQALPLAQQLAREWSASLWLAQVVRSATAVSVLSGPYAVAAPYDPGPQLGEAHQYLMQVASALTGEVHTDVFDGVADKELATAARYWGITDIVMASHGRTGLSRVVLGSVADGLVHRLHCPIIVVPALVVQAMQQRQAALTTEESMIPV